MQLPIDRLFKGIIYTINGVILPELSSPYARAQTMAIGSTLQNVMVRMASIDKLQLAQNNSLKEIFQRMERILSEHSNVFKEEDATELLGEISQQLQTKYESNNPLADENCALKQMLEKVIEFLWTIKEAGGNETLKELHDSIRHFLKQEVEAELSLLSPIDMAGVSKGK